MLLGTALLASLSPNAQAATWTTTPSFHAISLYYGPFASGDDPLHIQYRPAGAPTWKDAQDLFLDRTAPANLAQFRNQYRGSIVNLKPNTLYNLQFKQADGEWTAIPSVATRSAIFPGTSVTFSGIRTTKLVISEGGSPSNWRIYDGQFSTIDTNHTDNCVEINAPYVVLKNFTIADCKFQAIVASAAHVVISNNDISDWGAQEYYYPSKGKAFTGSQRLSSPANTCITGTDKRSLARADDAAIWRGHAGRSAGHPDRAQQYP